MTTTADHETASPDQAFVPKTRLGEVAGIDKFYGAMSSLENRITLDPELRELVKLRASALNGCAFCVDMHTTDARAAGETDRRLASVVAWQHAPFFTPRERAALALTDAMTRLDPEGVPESVWEEVKAYFPPEDLGQLVFAIVQINSWNRIAITLLNTPPE